MLKRALPGQHASEASLQIARFVAAATSANHPNLIPILDASTTAATPYLVMPRLEGESMQHHLTSAHKKPLPVALWLIRQIAQGLEALHTAGWIHGDVKPANALVGATGHVTLLDLGFAARVHTPSARISIAELPSTRRPKRCRVRCRRCRRETSFRSDACFGSG